MHPDFNRVQKEGYFCPTTNWNFTQPAVMQVPLPNQRVFTSPQPNQVSVRSRLPNQVLKPSCLLHQTMVHYHVYHTVYDTAVNMAHFQQHSPSLPGPDVIWYKLGFFFPSAPLLTIRPTGTVTVRMVSCTQECWSYASITEPTKFVRDLNLPTGTFKSGAT